MNSIVPTVFKVVTDENNVFMISIAVLFFISMISLLGLGSKNIVKDLRSALKEIKKSGINSRSQGSTDESFHDLDRILRNNITLEHSWNEFKEGLVRESSEFESNGTSSTIVEYKNAIEAEHFFNFDTIVINSHRWMFGLKYGVFDSVPNLLTGLGIFGTFVGIVAALPDGHIDQSSMDTFISGMKVAFGTSIAGLALAMTFTFIEKWLHDYLEQRVNEVATKIDFLFKRKSQQEYLHSIAQGVLDTRDAINLMSKDIGKKVAEGFTQFGISELEINEAVKEGIQQGMAKLSDNLRDILERQEILNRSSRELVDLLSRVNQDLITSESSISAQNESIQSTTNNLSSMSQLLEGVNASLIPQLEKNLGMVDNLVRASEQNNNNVERIFSEGDRLSGQYNEIHKILEAAVANIGQSFENYQLRSKDAVEGTLQSFDRELANGVTRLSGVVHDMSSLSEDIHSIISKISQLVLPPSPPERI